MPWKAPDENVREPVDKPQDLQATLGINPYARYAQLAQAVETDPSLIAQAMANAANVELQAALTENIEIQLTPEIKALAAEFNNNSVEIYTWFHNNIRYIPSHGSIQGAQHTLETKQGNMYFQIGSFPELARLAKVERKRKMKEIAQRLSLGSKYAILIVVSVVLCVELSRFFGFLSCFGKAYAWIVSECEP